MIKIGLVGASGCAGGEFLPYSRTETVAISSWVGVAVPAANARRPARTWLPHNRDDDGAAVRKMVALDETAGLCQHPL